MKTDKNIPKHEPQAITGALHQAGCGKNMKRMEN